MLLRIASVQRQAVCAYRQAVGATPRVMMKHLWHPGRATGEEMRRVRADLLRLLPELERLVEDDGRAAAERMASFLNGARDDGSPLPNAGRIMTLLSTRPLSDGQLFQCEDRLEEIMAQFEVNRAHWDVPGGCDALGQRIREHREWPSSLHSAVTEVRNTKRKWFDARDHMTLSNARLAYVIADKVARRRGCDLLDCLSWANIGLVRAVDSFDPERGVRFGTYAGVSIERAITKGIDDEAKTGRFPPSAGVNGKRSDGQSGGSVHAVSLQTALGEGVTLGDILADPQTPDPGSAARVDEMRQDIDDAIRMLTPKEQHVVTEYFGLGPDERYGQSRLLSEIGGDLGISKQRVAQILKKSIEQLADTRQPWFLRLARHDRDDSGNADGGGDG